METPGAAQAAIWIITEEMQNKVDEASPVRSPAEASAFGAEQH
jgi:hypothetical protein